MRQARAFAGLTALSAAFLVGLTAGCQHGTTPTVAPEGQRPAESITLPGDQTYLGAYDFTLDVGATPSATLDAARDVTAIGDTFNEVGLSGALRGDLCDCFEVTGLELVSPTRVRANFSVKHPFLPEFRPDLHAFNLKAQVATDQVTGLGTEQVAAGIVANADGYSPLWIDQVPGGTATLLPYVVLSRDLTSAPFDFQNPAGFNVFAVGQTYEHFIEFELGTASSISVRLYLTVDYGQSAVRATRQTPAYELPKFAGKAPWRVAVTEIDNNLTDGEPTSNATYQVDVWDWAHGAGVGSDVTGGQILIPALGVSQTLPAMTGTGLDPDPLTVSTIVPNTASAIEGDYWGLVQITDAAASGVALADDLTTLLNRDDYSTWQAFPVSVGPGVVTSLPPVAVIGQPCTTMAIIQNRTYTFDGTGSTDDVTPAGSLIYEWDFDYDGFTFTVDATGLTTTHSFAVLGPFTIALRVTDGELQTNIASRPITVIALAWRNIRNASNTATSEQMDNQGGACESRVFIDSTGEAHVLYRDGAGIVTVGHLGSACTPNNAITPLGISTNAPSVQQEGDRLHMVYLTPPGSASITYNTFDLLPRTFGTPEIAMTAAALPPPIASSFNSCRLARDSSTGHLFVIGESGFSNFDLYSVERPAVGAWSTPILADNRTATSFAMYGDAAVSNGECFIVYMDGGGISRVGYYLRKPAGAAAWPPRTLMGTPNGPHLCYWLVDGPGEDLLGSYFDNPSGSGAIAYYLRWNSTTQVWTSNQIGNLGQYNFFPNVCWNPTNNEVTVVWENILTNPTTPRRILSKRFQYDALPAVIGDGNITVVSDIPGTDNNEPSAAFNPVTGETIAVWERDMDPSGGVQSDLFTGEW